MNETTHLLIEAKRLQSEDTALTGGGALSKARRESFCHDGAWLLNEAARQLFFPDRPAPYLLLNEKVSDLGPEAVSRMFDLAIKLSELYGGRLTAEQARYGVEEPVC